MRIVADFTDLIQLGNLPGMLVGKGKESAGAIAQGYRKYIKELCRMNNIRLNEDEHELLHLWINGKAIPPPIADLAN